VALPALSHASAPSTGGRNSPSDFQEHVTFSATAKPTSKKQRRKSMNGRKSKTAEAPVRAKESADGSDTESSYSSSGSDSEMSMSSAFSKRSSVKANQSAKRVTQKAVAHTAQQAAHNIISFATESIKTGTATSWRRITPRIPCLISIL
jgi:hypothetical protein